MRDVAEACERVCAEVDGFVGAAAIDLGTGMLLGERGAGPRGELSDDVRIVLERALDELLSGRSTTPPPASGLSEEPLPVSPTGRGEQLRVSFLRLPVPHAMLLVVTEHAPVSEQALTQTSVDAAVAPMGG